MGLRLNKGTFKQNEPVFGRVYLQFNKMQHRVKRINVILVMNYFTETRDKEEVILAKEEIHKAFPTLPYEEKVIDFRFNFPMNLPLTTNSLIYQLFVEIEYDKILNQKTSHQINIIPSDEFKMLLDIFVQDLGFQASYRSGLYLNKRQIFSFHPPNFYANKGLNDMTVVIQYNEFYYQINFYYIIYQQKFKNSITLYHNVLFKFDGGLNREEVKKNVQSKINQQFQELQLM